MSGNGASKQTSAVDECLAEARETALVLQQVDWSAVRAAEARTRAAGRPVGEATDLSEACHAVLVGLREALTARGLAVVTSGGVLCARNLEADPPDDDPQAWALTPGLSQSVLCRPGPGGRPWLWWVWPAGRTAAAAADTDQEQDGIEPLCAADDVEYAADRIAQVLAVLPEGR